MAFLDPSHAFLSSPPEWTLHGALIVTRDGRTAHVEQRAWTWSEGSWEAGLAILPVEPPEGTQSVYGVVRVSPETLRRWKEVGINPFIEASAQIAELWRTARKPQTDQPPTFNLL